MFRKKEAEVFPLLTVSSQQAREILASRTERLLVGGGEGPQHDAEGEEIPCTPAFGGSGLAGQLVKVECPTATIAGLAGRKEGAWLHSERDDHLFYASDEEKGEGNESLDEGGHSSSKNEGEVEPNKGTKDGSGCSEDVVIDQELNPSQSHDSQQVDPLKASFVDEFKGLSYPTLWQLGSGELSTDVMGDFYVTALSSLISPSKVQHSVLLY